MKESEIKEYMPEGTGGSALPGEDSSGFTENLDDEIAGIAEMNENGAFTDFRTICESHSGAAVLLTATRFGKKFTLKCLKPEFRCNPLYRRALYKEFEIGYGLDHPNIRQTVGFETLPVYGPAIVMEYIDGETLEQAIAGGGMSPGAARDIALQLAGAIDYLHRKQVVHRDLKPCNVMVSHMGRTVKLIDFSLSDGSSYTVIKAQAGTKMYMAPEQLKDGVAASTKTDIYSFGMILGEIAHACGDKVLQRLASVCAERDAGKRPESLADVDFSGIKKESGQSGVSFWDSPALTWILVSVIAFSILMILF